METLFTVLLYIHIAFGTLSLLIGTWIMIQKKGDKKHKNQGIIYVWSMIINAFASFYLSIYNPNYFLFIVGVFSMYMALSGYRVMTLKRLDGSQKPTFFDWTLTGIMAVFGLAFLVYGACLLIGGNTFGSVLIVFGLISVLFVMNDYKYYMHQQKNKHYWMRNHISKMVGSYISALTAFLVVNNTYFPDVIAWLLPSVIGVFLIIKWHKPFK